jgi:hypothetical protein
MFFGVILHHNNATPRIAYWTQALLQSFCWELLNHSHYSPYLALLKQPFVWASEAALRRSQ